MKYQGFSQTLLLTPMNKAFETPTVTPHTGVWIETKQKLLIVLLSMQRMCFFTKHETANFKKNY